MAEVDSIVDWKKKYEDTYGVWRHAVAQLVEALRCKPEGRGFDS
jgi:hypothetical protein